MFHYVPCLVSLSSSTGRVEALVLLPQKNLLMPALDKLFLVVFGLAVSFTSDDPFDFDFEFTFFFGLFFFARFFALLEPDAFLTPLSSILLNLKAFCAFDSNFDTSSIISSAFGIATKPPEY